MKQTIFDKLKNYSEFRPSRWHTPGHKGLLSRFDITEIDDSFPAHCVSEAESNAAKIFGSKAVRFLTNGSSMGIKAGIMSLDGEFLTESNCHCAVREALALSNKVAHTVQNIVKNDLPQPLTASQIDEEIRKRPSIKTVVVTSPDYYGQTADVSQIVSVTKKHGVRLYVDAAHGAHFSFRPDLFPTSFTGLADICNISAHKTMPAFTQTAYLCINDESLLERVDNNLRLLGTTSPSYLFLAGLEYACETCRQNAAHYDEIFDACNAIKRDIKCLDNDDFSRIVVDAKHYGLSGTDLYYSLKKRGVVAEKFDDRYVVFIATICDDGQKILLLKDKIMEALDA